MIAFAECSTGGRCSAGFDQSCRSRLHFMQHLQRRAVQRRRVYQTRLIQPKKLFIVSGRHVPHGTVDVFLPKASRTRPADIEREVVQQCRALQHPLPPHPLELQIKHGAKHWEDLFPRDTIPANSEIRCAPEMMVTRNGTWCRGTVS